MPANPDWPTKIVLTVQRYQVHLNSNIPIATPPPFANNALGLIQMAGNAQGKDGAQFWLYFFVDGTQLPPLSFDPKQNAVLLYYNWCQFQAVIQLLKTSKSVQGIFYNYDPAPWADVEAAYAIT